MRKSLSLMLVFVFILTLSACNNAKAPSVRSALIEQFSHAQQPLSAEISPSPSSTGRPLLSMPGDTSDGQVFDSPNGDGYTPYNLKWDIKNGAITFEVQQNSIWEETNEGTIYNGYKIAIFRDGSAIHAEEWGGYTDYVRIEIDLFEGEGEWLSAEEVEYRRKLFEPDGEYVFTVYAYNYEEDKVLGEVAKSEPYIVGGSNATQPSETLPEPLGLEVDLRSETQAVFTILNADLSPADSDIGANYNRQWVLSFDEHRFVVGTSLSPGESPNNDNTDAEGYNWLCDFEIKEDKLVIGIYLYPNHGQTEGNLPPGYDLRNIADYAIEYVEADDTWYPETETFTFPASDVADDRNWGQTYRVSRTWPMERFIQGTMRQEQYETLYFTPPTDNYILAEAAIDSADYYSRSASAFGTQPPGGAFTTNATVLAWFDENDKLLGIVQRFDVPSSESGHAMMDAWQNINSEHTFYRGATVYFKDDTSDYGWYYRPLIDSNSGFGPENQSTQSHSLEKNVIYMDDFSAFVEGVIYKADYIAALESGHHDLLIPFTVTENNS